MIINFRIREINQDACKLTRIFTLIIKKKTYLNIFWVKLTVQPISPLNLRRQMNKSGPIYFYREQCHSDACPEAPPKDTDMVNVINIQNDIGKYNK
jgi:hypothetical protein